MVVEAAREWLVVKVGGWLAGWCEQRARGRQRHCAQHSAWCVILDFSDLLVCVGCCSIIEACGISHVRTCSTASSLPRHRRPGIPTTHSNSSISGDPRRARDPQVGGERTHTCVFSFDFTLPEARSVLERLSLSFFATSRAHHPSHAHTRKIPRETRSIYIHPTLPSACAP